MAKRLKKRHFNQDGQDDNSGGWQVIYTGFILILLCFFIMLTSFASLQQSRITRFARSFSAAVSILGGGRSIEHGKTILFEPGHLVDKEARIARLFQKTQIVAASLGIDPDMIRMTPRGVVLTLSGAVVFPLGRADINRTAQKTLDKVAELIKQIPVHVQIEGHTDNLPLKSGSYASNWELSTARATNVLRYLIQKHGIAATRMSAVGFGPYQPVVPNDSAANRSKNRRVEFVFSIGD